MKSVSLSSEDDLQLVPSNLVTATDMCARMLHMLCVRKCSICYVWCLAMIKFHSVSGGMTVLLHAPSQIPFCHMSDPLIILTQVQSSSRIQHTLSVSLSPLHHKNMISETRLDLHVLWINSSASLELKCYCFESWI